MKIVYALLFTLGSLAQAREICHARCVVVQSGYVTTFELSMLYGFDRVPGSSILRQDLGQVRGDSLEDLKKSCQTLVDRDPLVYLASEVASIHLAQDLRVDSSHGQNVVTELVEKSSCP